MAFTRTLCFRLKRKMKKNEFTDICVAFNGVPLGSPNRIEAERIRRFPDFHSNSPPLIRPRWKRAFVSSPSLLLNGGKKEKKNGTRQRRGRFSAALLWLIFIPSRMKAKKKHRETETPFSYGENDFLSVNGWTDGWNDGWTNATAEKEIHRERNKR